MSAGMFADQASAFASADRDVAADQLLTSAVREGIAAFTLAHRMERMGVSDPHTGLRDAVATTLLKAGVDAEMILGRSVAVSS